MFASEEAAFGLVLADQVLGEPGAREAARRALDYLTGPKYGGFFAGQFIYGADAWTCVAADQAWPVLSSPRYLDFCLGYASFLRRLQFAPAGWPPGFAGHYGFSALMVPQAPAAGGFSESVVATLDLARHYHQDHPELVAQLHAGLDALVRDQIRPDNDWMMPHPDQALGGIRRSLVEQEIRIDFPQHAIAAWLRGARAEE
jgi:hypothetical protein